MIHNDNSTFHDLSIGHCNIQGGLTSIGKTNEIRQLIRDYDFDVLSLNETNLNDTINSSTLNTPPCYDFIRKDRGKGSRGGCGILVSQKCAYTEITMKTEIVNIEAIWLKIKSYNIYVCGFYRSNNFCSVDFFIDYMNECMSKLHNKKVIWIGDVNIDQNNISASQYKKLDMTLKSFNMVQTIQGITRVAKFGEKFTSSTIDVIFTNCYSDFINSSVLPERIGDHQAIKCQLAFKVRKPARYEKLVIRNRCYRNVESLAEFLALQCDYSQILECSDVDSAAIGLNEHLNKYYDEFCPLKTITVHENYINKPSGALLKAIKRKRSTHKIFQVAYNNRKRHMPYCNGCKNCALCIKVDTTWRTYKKQRNLVTTLSKKNKQTNIVNDLKQKSASNDLKGIWKTIKSAANLSPSSNKVSTDSKCPLDPVKLNEHFSTIGGKIQAEVPVHDNMHFSDFLPQLNSELSFSSFLEVSSSQVESYIKTLSQDKAVFDMIPIKTFKAILPAIIEPVTHIINLSLKTGIVPSCCKYAQVTPIHKGGDKEDENNYRPISILPILAKSIEYFVNEQLREHMESNNLFTEQQYGFRKNYSTTYLMLDLFDDIFDSKSRANRPAIVFLDMKKAFDTVSHHILLKKLEYYGIQGTVIKWFASFLSNRFQCTRVNKSSSSYLSVSCGVPQGSILGPLLFSIFINDIVNACHLSKPYLFADDGALYFDDICRITYLNIRVELLNINKWLDLNKLSLNVAKTNFIVFDTMDYNDRIYLDTNSTNAFIDESKTIKYLGLMVDNKLCFNEHIELIKKKVAKRIGAMYRCKNLLPLKYRKMFANALMLPLFDYLDTIYSKACKTKLNDLDVLYKKVAKIALDVPTRESSLIVYRDMNWLPLHLRRQVHLSAYMYRIINGTSPSNCMNKFKFISGGSRDSTKCNLYTHKSKTLKDFYYLGAKCWNVLPTHLRETDGVKVFSKVYKAQLLASIQSDQNYRANNHYSNFYEIVVLQSN